jgi:hypothetical protein
MFYNTVVKFIFTHNFFLWYLKTQNVDLQMFSIFFQ